jgi:hypothetical protein
MDLYSIIQHELGNGWKRRVLLMIIGALADQKYCASLQERIASSSQYSTHNAGMLKSASLWLDLPRLSISNGWFRDGENTLP